MKKSFIAVSAGAPLLALGVAAAPAAWAAPSQESQEHGAEVSINGVTKRFGPGSAGTPESTVKPPNVAIAVGVSEFDPSSAVIFGSGSGNQAISINGGSTLITDGSNNTTVATGNNLAIVLGASGRHCHNGGDCT